MFNEEILEIRDRLIKSTNALQIYLFGSFANGTWNDDSDYDFYIVVADENADRIALAQKAYGSLRGMKRRPVDIVINTETAFKNRTSGMPIEEAVAREGVLLYG